GRLLEDAAAETHGHGGGPVRGPELREQRRQLSLDRGQRDAELASDLLVRSAVGHQPDDVELSRGEQLRGRQLPDDADFHGSVFGSTGPPAERNNQIPEEPTGRA